MDKELERSKVNSRLEQEKIGDEERANHVRPWDKGKGVYIRTYVQHSHHSQPHIIVVDMVRKRKQELEKERLPEFAPPPSYTHDDQPTKKPRKTDSNPDTAPVLSRPAFPPPPPILPSSHGNVIPPPPPWFVPPHYMPPPPPFLWQYPSYPPPPPPGQPPPSSATDQPPSSSATDQ